MKFWNGSAAAALAIAAPAQAVELAQGEIALHISAQAAIPADYATVSLDITGDGSSQVEAEAALHGAEDATIAALDEVGVTSSAVEKGKPLTRKREASELAALDAAASAAYEAARLASEDGTHAVDTFAGGAGQQWSASATMTITIGDLTKAQAIMQATRASYTYPVPRPKFFFRDEAKAQRDVVAAALAKAKADAQLHAEALGYRVARIVAVTNDGPPLSISNVIQAFASIDNPARDWGLAGQKIATVGVDFVIAPK